MLKPPPVTVVMPVYNAETYLKESIESILNQTYDNFDFFIINDYSSDRSEEIIKSYNDTRIKYFKNELNSGRSATRNKGIQLSNSKYLLLMDADDISLPYRIDIQKKYMDVHPEVGVSSCFMQTFGNEREIWEYPLKNEEIKAELVFNMSFAHSASIFRTEVLKKNNIYYLENFSAAEDYDLFFRLKDVTSFNNIPEILYLYRRGPNHLDDFYKKLKVEKRKIIFRNILKELGIEPTDEELLLHMGIWNVTFMPTRENIIKLSKWLNELIEANKQLNVYSQKEFIKTVDKRWNSSFSKIYPFGFKSVFIYWRKSRQLNLEQILYYSKFLLNKLLQGKS